MAEMLEFSLPASDGAGVQCYSWTGAAPRAVVHIAHGMGEHAKRYQRVAGELNDAGYAVYANDHRGHGITGQSNLGYFGGDGWNRALADAYEINRHIRAELPDLPVVLLGHSMGSTMAQQYITRYGASIDALVLSGSPGYRKGPLDGLGRLTTRYQIWRHGPDQTNDQLQRRFGSANKKFDGPNATGFEWLSRDADEVKKYVDDPFCGFVVAPGSLLDYMNGASAAFLPQCLEQIPKRLPIYVFVGSEDPVHAEERNVLRMIDAYRGVGVRNVEYKVYPGGRHEMFNETNRDEVVRDLIAWLDKTVGKGGA